MRESQPLTAVVNSWYEQNFAEALDEDYESRSLYLPIFNIEGSIEGKNVCEVKPIVIHVSESKHYKYATYKYATRVGTLRYRPGALAATIKLTTADFQRFLEFYRTYWMMGAGCIKLLFEVCEPSETENILAERKWDGEPSQLDLMAFQYTYYSDKTRNERH